MKTTVIYHRADYDGLFCREIARKFLPDAQLIGWDYGDDVPDVDTGGHELVQLYMFDISIPELMDYPRLIWIDHHKSAIEKYNVGDAFSGSPGRIAYLIDGVAACRLAWQWFRMQSEMAKPENQGGMWPLPDKLEYVNRSLPEPLAVRLAGEYDIWDKRDMNADLFQHGLRSQELTQDIWDSMLVNEERCQDLAADSGTITVHGLLEAGRAIQYAKTKEDADIIKAYGFTVHFEGLTFLACNHARFNSHLFTAAIKPEHDALLGFNWSGTDWRVSLYHAPGKEQHDLSLIAVKYGGGGHRGACGFRVKDIEFRNGQMIVLV